MVYLRYFETKQEALVAEDLVAPLTCFINEDKTSVVSSTNFNVGDRLRIRKNSENILEVIPYNLTIAYSSVRGVIPSSKTVNYEYVMTSSDLLPPESSGNYDVNTFLGWYIGDTKIEAGYKVKSNITLVAKFNDLIQYTITYSSDHDTGNIPDPKSVINGYMLVSSDLPVLSEGGWTFLGWNKMPGDVITGNTEIVASWEVQSCTINYETSHGLAPVSKTKSYGYSLSAEDLPELSPIEKWDFEYWQHNESRVEVGFTISENPTTLVAKWNESRFIISYDNKGKGAKPDSKMVASGYKLTSEDLPDLIEEGYVFKGWYIGENQAAVNYEIDEDTVLEAKWKQLETVYKKITDTSEIIEGEYLIVCESFSDIPPISYHVCVLNGSCTTETAINTKNIGSYFLPSSFINADGTIKYTTTEIDGIKPTHDLSFNLEGTNMLCCFRNYSVGKYIGNNGSSTDILLNSEITTIADYNFSVSYDLFNEEASINSIIGSRTLRHNHGGTPTVEDDIFKFYTSSEVWAPIQLYKKITREID